MEVWYNDMSDSSNTVVLSYHVVAMQHDMGLVYFITLDACNHSCHFHCSQYFKHCDGCFSFDADFVLDEVPEFYCTLTQVLH